MVSLRADPWSPEYGMGLEAASLTEEDTDVDPSVETTDWSRPLHPATGEPIPLAFVDGVRRVDLRLWASEDGVEVPGLFGSVAVGSVRCDGSATFGDERVRHVLIVGGGITLRSPRVAAGKADLDLEVHTVAGTDVMAPLVGLQQVMRRTEAQMAETLAGKEGWIVLVDGPVSFLPPALQDSARCPVVGLVKRMTQAYLSGAEAALLPLLATGERTPLFALGSELNRRYAWYLRLAPTRPPWHDHAGLLRCEVRTGVGLRPAVDLADGLSATLPSFAGRASDPRAPQNLAPVGALEARLRHRMGHPAFVRRSLQEWLVMSA